MSSREYMEQFLTALNDNIEVVMKGEELLLIDGMLKALADTFTSERVVVMLLANKKDCKVEYSFNEKRENYDVWIKTTLNGNGSGSPVLSWSIEKERGISSDKKKDIGSNLWEIGIESIIAVPIALEKGKRSLFIICNRNPGKVTFKPLFTTYEEELTRIFGNRLLSPPVNELLHSTISAVDRTLILKELLIPLQHRYQEMFEEAYMESELWRLKARLEIARWTLEEFAAIIEKKSVKERDIQKLLKKSPWLFGLEFDTVKSQKRAGENVMDFLLTKYNGDYVIVELKRPTDRLFVGSGKTVRKSDKLNRAIDQIRNYQLYHSKYYEYIYASEQERIFMPRGLIVMGRTDENYERLKIENAILRDVEIVTYDDFLERAKRIVEWELPIVVGEKP